MAFSKPSYKSKRFVRTPRDKWIVTEGTHEAIIRQDIWDTAQRIRNNGRRRHTSHGEMPPLSGYLFCADCGSKLILNRNKSLTNEQEFYNCRKYNTYRYGEQCTSHRILKVKIDQIVLNDIRSVAVYARDNEPVFVREVEQVIRKAEAGSTHDAEIELARATSRIAEIDRIINGLYEDKIRGLLTPERFASMMTNYETEQKALRERATELRTSRDKQKEDAEAAKQFISLVKRYTDATELTPEMISGLISKIIVGRFSKEHQDITIEYRVIGKREPMR